MGINNEKMVKETTGRKGRRIMEREKKRNGHKRK